MQHTAVVTTSSVGRMQPNTALAFVLLSTALLLLAAVQDGRSRRGGFARVLTATAGFIYRVGLDGCGRVRLWLGESTSMVLPTAGLFMLLGLACAVRAWRSAELQLAISRRLLAGFGLGLVLFLVLSMLSNKSARELSQTDDWVRHTHEVLARIQKVNSDLITVQTAVGGFVISGREDFLVPYQAARRELEDDERILRRLTADNPRQQQRLTRLEEFIRQRLAYGEETLDLQRQHGFAAAAALISAGGGLEIMKTLRGGHCRSGAGGRGFARPPRGAGSRSDGEDVFHSLQRHIHWSGFVSGGAVLSERRGYRAARSGIH